VTSFSIFRATADRIQEEHQDRQRSRRGQRGQQDQTTAATVASAEVEDTFGNLFDGLNCKCPSQLIAPQHLLTIIVDPLSNDEESLSRHRSAYQLRRDLAEFSVRPEGVHYSWISSNGRAARAPLLTPPTHEAVQREDGSWYRAPRMPGTPIPYTQAWYEEYLRAHSLPSWFLRPRHLSMLNDDDEPAHLQYHNAASVPLAIPPPHDYLESLYPAMPLWPEPGHTTYRLEGLSIERRANLVRHYPAVGITTFPYNVFVFPEGNIQLRSLDEVHNLPSISEAELTWVPYNYGSMVPSSYHQERTGPHPLSLVNPSSERDALVQAAVNSHAIVNPMEDIPGLGGLLFLSEADRLDAATRGYATPYEVSLARRRGDLAVGTGINAGPIVVFRPVSEFLNPVEQPQGQGAWRFLTSDGETSNANLADIQFGGTRGLPRHPSARQIRQLGQLFIRAGRTNLAAQIDLVWVPGAEDSEEDVDMTLDEADLQEDDEEEEEPYQTQHSPRYTPDGLLIDPTNNRGVRGGAHDQTGAWAEYQTMVKHGGRTITIDRSRAWLNYPEPHKLEGYSSRGWRKWKHAATMDWKSKKKVDNLNKFREQIHSHKRGGWPLLREVKRQDYSPEELEFVMELLKAAGKGKRVKMKGKNAEEFYRRFPLRAQSDTGLQSLADRLKTEYSEHGGLKSRNPRGWKQRQMSHAARGSLQVAQSRDRVESEEGGDDEDGEGDEGEGEGEEGDEDGEGEEVEEVESEEDADEAGNYQDAE